MNHEEKLARRAVERWLWDCGEGNQTLGFVQSELLQQRIVEAIRSAKPMPIPPREFYGELMLCGEVVLAA